MSFYSVSPYFVLRPSPGLGLAGGSLLLPCLVGGSPRPRVHWRRLDGGLPVGRLHYTEVRYELPSAVRRIENRLHSPRSVEISSHVNLIRLSNFATDNKYG